MPTVMEPVVGYSQRQVIHVLAMLFKGNEADTLENIWPWSYS